MTTGVNCTQVTILGLNNYKTAFLRDHVVKITTLFVPAKTYYLQQLFHILTTKPQR